MLAKVWRDKVIWIEASFHIIETAENNHLRLSSNQENDVNVQAGGHEGSSVVEVTHRDAVFDCPSASIEPTS